MVRLFAVPFLLALVSAAAAADIAAPVPPAVDVPVAPGLWRGHFSGGVNNNPYADDIAFGWTDQVAFFPDDRSCRRWIRSLKAQIRPYEGWTGCLRVR